jgi:hypothetical protein
MKGSRLTRMFTLGLILYVLTSIGTTLGPDVMTYPEAKWNGRVFVETGRMKVVCVDQQWLCTTLGWLP